MKIEHDVSAQNVSWVKSNKDRLQSSKIDNLYYPESVDELHTLVKNLIAIDESFQIIGCSSNTLFLPSFKAKHLICTKNVNDCRDLNDEIICDCGSLVKQVAKEMVDKGYVGFEGLTDLPGTIAAGVYGNCGCRGCSVLELVKRFTLLTPEGFVKEYTVADLNPKYRMTSLKNNSLKGVILQVVLKKIMGNRDALVKKAAENHEIRKAQQPSAANNLGTTFIGSKRSLKGKILVVIERLMQRGFYHGDARKSCHFILKICGKKKFIPYVYCWKRYMFLDAESHVLFPLYHDFLKTLYKDLHLEIEIRG